MALDIIEFSVFIPDKSANVLPLLNHMRTQVNTVSDPILSLGDLINQWFRSRPSWWKRPPRKYFRKRYLNLCFLLRVPILWSLLPVQPDSYQTIHVCASEPFACPQGTLRKRNM